MGKHGQDLKPEDLINEPLYLVGRLVSGRTFQFDHDDIFLDARPNYVLWRLFFRTRPPLDNVVDGWRAGPECAIKQLAKASRLDPNVGINNAIKWACYGLTAQFLQFAFSSYPDDRATRRVRGIRPTDEDRFTSDRIGRLLTKFRDLHNKRVKEAKLRLDDQYDTEKGWLLVLGACALIHATSVGSIDGVIEDVARLLGIITSVEEKVSSLSRAGKMNTTGVLADIDEAVSKCFPGWQPGFSIPLQSFRQRKDGHTFYSALLPIHPDSYSHWAGEALGFLSKIALLQSTFYEAADRSKARRDRQLAFRLQMSAIQCHEDALWFYDNPAVERPRDYVKKVPRIRERLIVMVDHARTLASYAGATYWEYGLAALHLRYCCSGGLQDPLDRIRLRSLKINKAIALAGGCQIPSEVESRDLDDQNDDELADILLPERDGLEPRTGFLKEQERRRAGIRPRTPLSTDPQKGGDRSARRTQDGGVVRSQRQARRTLGVRIDVADVQVPFWLLASGPKEAGRIRNATGPQRACRSIVLRS